MTTIESKEIRGLTLKILYLLMAFTVISTAGVVTSYYSLKEANTIFQGQLGIFKAQLEGIDKRLTIVEANKAK